MNAPAKPDPTLHIALHLTHLGRTVRPRDDAAFVPFDGGVLVIAITEDTRTRTGLHPILSTSAALEPHIEPPHGGRYVVEPSSGTVRSVPRALPLADVLASYGLLRPATTRLAPVTEDTGPCEACCAHANDRGEPCPRHPIYGVHWTCRRCGQGQRAVLDVGRAHEAARRHKDAAHRMQATA